METLKQLSPENVGKLLQNYRINYCSSIFAKTKEDILMAAKSLGFPVVVKAVAPSLIHKTEAGAVKLNLKTEKEITEAIEDIITRIKGLEGFLLQRMLQGYEVIIGGKKDPQFGPVVVFGLGGIFVEVFKDVSLRVAPINEEEALRMIEETKAYSLLKGVRGKPPADIKSLAKMIALTSTMVTREGQIKELDFNPVFVNEKEAVVADARVILE